jgi:hypothetical protein
MDRESGKTRVYERAETGTPVYLSGNDMPPENPVPFAGYPLYGMRGSIGFLCAVRPGWS